MIQKPISTPWLKCETPQLRTVLGYKFNHLAINSTTDLAGEADIVSSLSASAKHNSGWIEGQVVQSVSAHGGLKVKKETQCFLVQPSKPSFERLKWCG